jgi:hypothetical protein
LIDRVVLKMERDILVPLLLVSPASRGKEKLPVVVGLAQGGKQGFLRHRSEIIARLLGAGVAVCLPDLRGTGETSPGGPRGRSGRATALSSSELMLGQTLVGARLRDLGAVLRYLRGREGLDVGRIALWGDSFAPVNPLGRRLEVPLDAEALPPSSEPLGGLLALLGALYHDDVRAVYAHGGLAGYQSVLQSPFCYVPHDVIVPGALTSGDLGDVAAALSPRPLRLEGMVDGLNRSVSAQGLAAAFEPARAAYRSAKYPERLSLAAGQGSAGGVARWLVKWLQAGDR